MNNYIFLIVGESGSGKTSIVSLLEKRHSLKSIQSYTTRPKRYENEYGHIFVSENEFNLLENLVGYTLYNGYQYCATSQQVEDNDLYVIDIAGINFFKENYKGNKIVKTIYIKSDMPTRFDRMIERGKQDGLPHKEACDFTLKRIINDVIEFKNIKEIADFVVTNNEDDFLENVTDRVWKYIKNEKGM